MAKRTKKAEHKLFIFINSLIVLAVLIIASQQLGYVGQVLNKALMLFIGTNHIILYAIVAIFSIYTLIFRSIPSVKLRYKFAVLITIIIILTLNSYFTVKDGVSISTYFKDGIPVFNGTDPQGGVLGILFYTGFTVLFDRLGTLIVMGLLLILVFFLSVDMHKLKDKMSGIKPIRIKSKSSDDTLEPKQSVFIDIDEPTTKPSKMFDSGHELVVTSAATIHSIGNYSLPSLNLLDEVSSRTKSMANQNAANIKGKRLLEILDQFGINASLIGTHIGPAVTKFEVKPDTNIKISKIASIQDNIKMELSAKQLRIEAPIPGRNAVGVEIPNVEMIPVRMSEMMQELVSDKYRRKLLFPLGKDLMGKAVFAELDKMPHLLIAGATGSGKSVCVNSLITTFLLRTSPDELKFLLIDPKKVEFTSYHNIPHLIAPVISDAAEAARALKVIVLMMENRYEIFSKVAVRNITAYNERLLNSPDEHLEPMPWIIVIIDELADLMIVAGKEVEASIQRITQLARAAGIHLIVATQRPSTDVITGIIKANIPSRIAFAVASGIDSRTILDHIGAEKLLGYGDMLFYPVGEPSSIRIQGVFVSDDEVKKVAEATSLQRKPSFDDAFLKLNEEDNNIGYSSAIDDPMYAEVKQYIIETKRASTSSIQRRFGLGYNRAARIIDTLEQNGVIGPAQGSKPRDVY